MVKFDRTKLYVGTKPASDSKGAARSGSASTRNASTRPAPSRKSIEAPNHRLARVVRLVTGADKFLQDSLTDLGSPDMSDRARSYIEVAQKATAATILQLTKDMK